MIVRLWFRRNGAADGLWWTLDVEGVERHAEAIAGVCTFATGVMPGPTEETLLSERRHVVVFQCARVEWRGRVAVLCASTGPSGPNG